MGREGPDGARACSHHGTQGGTPDYRSAPLTPRGPSESVCVRAGGLGALGAAQQHRNPVTGSSPPALPSPRSHPAPHVVLQSGLLREGGRAGLQGAVRAGAGAGASLPALAGFNPSCWAAVPGALGSKGPGNERHVSSQQLGGALGPDGISAFGAGPGPGPGPGPGHGPLWRGAGVDTATEVCHCQGSPALGRGGL